MSLYLKNKKLLEKNHSYHPSLEHDACGVGLITSLDGKKRREIVEYAIQSLRAVWHRGAVDADGKSGDGAGICVEVPRDFLSLIFNTNINNPIIYNEGENFYIVNIKNI